MLPDDIAKLSLTSFDKYGTMARLVESQFRLHGIERVAPAADVPNLHLISESLSRKTVSLYQNSRAAEYALTYTVSYRIVVPGIDSQRYTTKVSRNFLDNPLTALAKSVEEDMLKDEMREQAAKQIMRKMARLKAISEPQTPAGDNAVEGEQTHLSTEAVADTQTANQLFDGTQTDAGAASDNTRVQ